MSAIRIRPATPDDAEAIAGFIRKLAIYEHEPVEKVKITPADIRRDGFGSNRRFEVLIAEMNGAAVGFALIFPNYSTWEGKPGLYVEDIYVEENVR